MERQITFNESNFIYSFSREPLDGEGRLPVTVGFDSINDFLKTLSENKEAKEYFKCSLLAEKEQIKGVVNSNGSIRRALEIYVKLTNKLATTEEDEDALDNLWNIVPFEYINYLFYTTNDKEILDKYSYIFTTDENGKIAYSSHLNEIIGDFAKRYMSNEEYEQFISDDAIGTDLWFKYYEAIIQEALDFEIE